ncbi:MAT1-2-1 [Paraphoma chrysanthemicola]|nr:MAT1-2-1 [Paraphoma chrysanthemicola]
MTTEYYNDISLPSEGVLSAPYEAAVAHFDGTLKTCVTSWQRGEQFVVLPIDIRDYYGDVLFGMLQTTLTKKIGEPATFTRINANDGPNTIVTLPQISKPQSPVPAKPVTVVGKMKKPPRPMNSWLMFRDGMHKILKAENPKYTVQEISTLCSLHWKGLDPDQRKPWIDAALAAKEEHARLYPDYKYSPRKPGIIKKRQSRKSKAASKAVAGTTTLDFASPPTMSMTAASPDNSIVNDVTGFTDFLNYNHAGEQIHDAESLRHDRIQEEMAADLGVNSAFDFFDDGAYALRAGADGNATLPSFYSDEF